MLENTGEPTQEEKVVLLAERLMGWKPYCDGVGWYLDDQTRPQLFDWSPFTDSAACVQLENEIRRRGWEIQYVANLARVMDVHFFSPLSAFSMVAATPASRAEAAFRMMRDDADRPPARRAESRPRHINQAEEA